MTKKQGTQTRLLLCIQSDFPGWKVDQYYRAKSVSYGALVADEFNRRDMHINLFHGTEDGKPILYRCEHEKFVHFVEDDL